MSQLGPATKAFEIMSIDTIGGFGSTRSTKKYIHLLVDHFTRYAFILTSKTQNANDFIKLVQTVLEIEKIGTILTDQYPGINSREFKNYLKKKEVQLIFTAINAPFSNGLNERLNQTLVNKIRCKINEEEKKRAWTSIARECVNKYNRLEHTITGFTPEYLLHGTDTSNIPEELRRKKNGKDWIKDKKLALERTLRSHKYNKSIFDRNRKHHEFNVGDMVFIENGNKLNRKKLEELRIGPFTIEKKISNSIYKIKTEKRNQDTSLFHVTKLIPMLEDEDD
ncbi:RNA-directed DNA polymerase [Camponotus japonicus]